ncbi:hypothetical protein JCM11251_006181 [Rhodosporidiobolus azoricus]
MIELSSSKLIYSQRSTGSVTVTASSPLLLLLVVTSRAMAPSMDLLHRHRPPENVGAPPTTHLRPSQHLSSSGSTASFKRDAHLDNLQTRISDGTVMTDRQPKLSRQSHLLHPRKRTASTPSVSMLETQQEQESWHPRKVVPPPQPVFPPSPPLSPEMVAQQMGEVDQGRGKPVEEVEEEQLKRALEASMREEREKVERIDSSEELAKALAESRALEQRRAKFEAQEQTDLEAALLASQNDLKPPTPPVSDDPSPYSSSSAAANQNRLYRPRSASLPTFSPSDLSYPSSSFPAEKSHAFPFLRPALPPGAAGAWDDESREMEMLALAIRISEEEEKERERLDRLEGERAVERVREAERVAMNRGKAGSSQEAAGTGPSTAFTSSTSLAHATPTAPPSTVAFTPATTLSSTTHTVENISSANKEKGHARIPSWFRPPLASKLSNAEPVSPLLPSAAPAARPALPAAQQSSTATVQTYRTAQESLPFSNFDPAPPAPEVLPPAAPTTKPPSPRVLRKLSRPPPPAVPPHPSTSHTSTTHSSAPPRPTRLPPTPPETPQTSSSATFQSAPQVGSMHFHPPPPPSHPPILSVSTDRLREEYNGSPVEMPYLTPTGSVRSSFTSGTGNGNGGRSRDNADHLRMRTSSGATASNFSHGGGSGGGSAGSDGSAEDEDVERASILAIRNPDDHPPSTSSASATSSLDDGEHGEGEALSAHSYTSGRDAYDGMVDIDAAFERYPAFPEDEVESLWAHDRAHQHHPLPLPGHPGGHGPFFESAYAGRSMSAIDEMTEPASSVVGTSMVGTDGGGTETRQGSFPSTLGSGSGVGTGERGETVGEGLWFAGVAGDATAGGGNLIPFPQTASPVSSLAQPPPRPAAIRRGSSSSSSASATAGRSAHEQKHAVPAAAYSPSLSQQHQQFQQAAWPGLSTPNPAAQPQHQDSSTSRVSVASAYTAATTVPGPYSPSLGAPSSNGHPPAVPPPQPATDGPDPLQSACLFPSDSSGGTAGLAPGATTPPLPAPAEEGLRFGYPSHCAREPGHSCPDDGLTSTTSAIPAVVPPVIELSSPAALPQSGLGLRDEPASPLRDSWAVEARSWVALVRFLLWHGDVSFAASSAEVARSQSGRCAAEARLEFRPDDEGGEVVRLVVELVKSEEAQERLARHRELSVTYPLLSSSSAHQKGKGKARAAPSYATFSLPDVLHLPTRLSSLAIQLYTLRHLGSIARATQPARSPPPPVLAASTSADLPAVEGYPALRALADSIGALARAAAAREQPSCGSGSGGYSSSPGDRTPRAGQVSDGRPSPVMVPEEQNQRLVDRLRERLRRLKRHGGGGGGGDENLPPMSASAAPAGHPSPAGPSNGFYQLPAHAQQGKRGSKLVKPAPPPRTQPIPRSERVLSAGQTIRSGEVGDSTDYLAGAETEERRDEVGVGRETSREEEERWEMIDRPKARRTSTQSQLRYLPEI